MNPYSFFPSFSLGEGDHLTYPENMPSRANISSPSWASHVKGGPSRVKCATITAGLSENLYKWHSRYYNSSSNFPLRSYAWVLNFGIFRFIQNVTLVTRTLSWPIRLAEDIIWKLTYGRFAVLSILNVLLSYIYVV